MIARLLVWFVDALVLYLMVRAVVRLLQGGRSTPAGAPRAKPIERAGGTLVRDPECGTYVPESRALRVTSGATTLYFCSTKCRDAYAARR